MTVTIDYIPVREQGNGVKVDFDFPFKIFQASDLVVGKVNRTTGIETPMALTTDYTVVIDPVVEGGTLTYVVAPTSNEDSFIRRLMDITQESDIPTNNLFREVQIENALDKGTMVDQQLQVELDRCLKVPDTVTVDTLLPLPDPGHALIWNPAGDAIINSTDIFDDIVTNAQIAAAAAAASAAAAAISEAAAAASAVAAAASEAAAAAIAAGILATSTTSLLIEVAQKVFTTQAGKQFAAGQFVTAASAADVANYMHGQVVSYSGTTLTVNVTNIGGAGTFADWNLSLSGTRGTTGATGAAGAPGAALARGTFVNGDLAVGKLTITHSGALSAPYMALVTIFDNTGKQVTPDEITGATNTVEVDLVSFGAIAGTWGYAYIV